MTIAYNSRFPNPRPAFANSWAHPSYAAMIRELEVIRLCVAGESAVKSQPRLFLPKYEAESDSNYATRVADTAFVNFVDRTAEGMTGALMRRPSEVSFPDRLKPYLNTISHSGQTISAFAQKLTDEIVIAGRAGVLVDRSADGASPAYLSLYGAESLFDWENTVIGGKCVLSYVVLSETRSIRVGPVRQDIVSYRKLYLDLTGSEPVYRQAIYWDDNNNASLDSEPSLILTPTNRGRTFSEIPFYFFGSKSNDSAVEKSPLADITKLNQDHFRKNSLLSSALYYVATPVYVANIVGNEDPPEFTIGPSRVWVLGQNDKASLLELSNNGVGFLSQAVKDIESQAVALGARLLGNRGAPSETDQNGQFRKASEDAALSNIANVLDNGLTKALRLLVAWEDGTDAEIANVSFRINREFVVNPAGAREFRAVSQLVLDNIVPLRVAIDYLKRCEVINGDVSDAEIERLIAAQTAKNSSAWA